VSARINAPRRVHGLAELSPQISQMNTDFWVGFWIGGKDVDSASRRDRQPWARGRGVERRTPREDRRAKGPAL